MKKILYIFFLLFWAGYLPAQIRVIDNKGTLRLIDNSKWQQTGNDIFNKNSGNVGIGISSPTATLHVSNNGSATIPALKIATPFIGLPTDNLLTWNPIDYSVRMVSGSSFVNAAISAGTGISISSANVISNTGVTSATATTPAAVVISGTIATIQNAEAYWNANQLQGINISSTAPTTTNNLLVYNGTNWVPSSLSSLGWLLTGNSSTNPVSLGVSYPTALSSSNNWIGTTDSKDFVIGANSNERIRVTSSGNIGVGITSGNNINSSYLMTVNPNSTISNGISMNLSGVSGTVYGMNISTATSAANGIQFSNSSAGSGFFGVGSVLSSANIVSGYLGYRNNSGISYGIYGINGTTATYAATNNTYAAFLQGRTVISSETSPTSVVGVDLEIRNTTTGSGNPAILSMRQTTSNVTSGTVLANVNFGDNYQTSPQAQIQAIRDAASGGATDLPTVLTFSTTADASSTLSERMRISNAGNVGIGTTNPTTLLHLNSSASPVFRLVDGTQGNNKILTSDANGNAAWATPAYTGTVTSIATNSGLTGGTITSSGTIGIATNGVTSSLFRQSATNTLVGNPTSGTANVTDITLGAGLAFSSGSLITSGIPNTSLQNSNISINGTPVSLGGTINVTAVNPNALTIGSGLQLNAGTTYDGSVAKTISLTNSTISGVALGSNLYALTAGTGIILNGTNGYNGSAAQTVNIDNTKVPYISTGFSNGLLKYNTGTASWSFDNNSYLTANQNITLSGDITGSGTTAITTTYNNIVPSTKGGAGSISGILKANGSGVVSAAVAGTDYLAPNTAITGATNTKITYDSKGIVTAGASAILASADFVNQGTATTVLHGNAAGAPSWGAINLSTDVTGTLPVANGGTGLTNIPANYLIYGNGTSAVSTLAPGTTNYILQTSATGVPQWISPSTLTVNNIYTSDGSLGATRTVTMNTNPITWNSTGTTGNIFTIAGNNLTSGNLLNLSSTATTTATGSLLNISSSSTGAITSGSGIVNFNFAAHTNNGFSITDATQTGTIENITANSLTDGSALTINANSLKGGSGINVVSTGTTITTGSLIKASGNVQTTTVTNGLLDINNTAAATAALPIVGGVVANINSNTGASGSGLIIYSNNSAGFGLNGTTAGRPDFAASANNGGSIPTFGVDGTVNATNYTSPVQTLPLASYTTTGIAWDLSKGTNIVVTNANSPTSATTQQYLITLTNLKAGMYGTLVIRQIGSATYQASNTIKVNSATTYSGTSITNNYVINGGGGQAILTTTSATAGTYVSDMLCFFFDGTNIWWTVGNNYN